MEFNTRLFWVGQFFRCGVMFKEFNNDILLFSIAFLGGTSTKEFRIGVEIKSF